MVNELDFNKENEMLFSHRGVELIKNFNKRNLEVSLFQDSEDVYAYIEKFIIEHPYIHNISFSDGVTLYQLGLYQWVKDKYKEPIFSVSEPLERGKNGHFVVFGDQPEGRMHLPYEEWKEKQDLWYENLRKSLMSDLLIISANAVTLSGEIVSVDGTGNRVAGMVFGPRHVLCIVGRNKIVANIDAAIDRIRNYVCPMTYTRHMLKHAASFQTLPCVNKGKCYDCNDENSACRDFVVIRGQIKIHKDRIHLLVVNKDLGF